MDWRRGDFWQERILPQRKIRSVRAKLGWTLTIMVILALVPVAGSIITVRRAEQEISLLLTEAIDPALILDDMQLALSQSRVARFDFIFSGDPQRGADASLTADFLAEVIVDVRTSWISAPPTLDTLEVLSRRYAADTRALVERFPGQTHSLRILGEDRASKARDRFRQLRRELEETPPGPDRPIALRQAREALLDLDDALIVTLGTGGKTDSLFQSVNESEGQLEDLSRNLYFDAMHHLRAERLAVARDLSLAVRDLVLVVAAVLAVGLFTALTAPRWVLRPVRRLSGLLYVARSGEIPDQDLDTGDDEVGELSRYLQEHLRQDRNAEKLRRRFHRANVQRIETLAAAAGCVVAAISTRDEIAFAGRKMRALLGIKDAAPVPLGETWRDPGLIEAVAALRRDQVSEKRVELTREPFAGCTARLLLTRVGDPAEAEVIVLVPHDEGSETPSG